MSSICEMTLVDRIRQYRRNPDFEAMLRDEDIFWKEVEAADKKLGPGLQIGRLVQWSVADGYASYLVDKITPRTVHLLHIPFGDGYQSPAVFQGKAPRKAVEIMIGFSDRFPR